MCVITDVAGKLAATAISSPLLSSVVLSPYGVLGTRLSLASGMVDAADPPKGSTAFVDPAGLVYIQRVGPSGAGGASGAAYAYLGIGDDEAFPAPVREAVTETLKAKFHKYTLPEGAGQVGCIHVVGPDFRKPIDCKPEDDPRGNRPAAISHNRSAALRVLATAYANVLTEFDESGLATLRLLPISGGIFAGPFGGEVAALTRDALALACDNLPPPVAKRLAADRRIELCIFMEKEWEEFIQAGFMSSASQ